MRRLLRRGMSIFAGSVLVAFALLAAQAGAQNAPAAWAPASAPPPGVTIVDGVVSPAEALAAPQQIQYQGMLLDPVNNPQPSGTYSMRFRLYEDNAENQVRWEEFQNVPVVEGYFSLRLGATNALSSGLFRNRAMYLGVKVGNDPEMSPRQLLTMQPYSFWAVEAGTAGRSNQIRAFGVVNSDGSTQSGYNFSSNFSGSDNSYVISIGGENYNLNSFATTVTAIRNNECNFPVIAVTGSKDGKLYVDLYRTNEAHVKCKFHFIVLEP